MACILKSVKTYFVLRDTSDPVSDIKITAD